MRTGLEEAGSYDHIWKFHSGEGRLLLYGRSFARGHSHAGLCVCLTGSSRCFKVNPTKAPHDFQVRGLLLLGIQHLSCTVGLEKTFEQLIFQVFLRLVASITCQIHQILIFHLDAAVLDSTSYAQLLFAIPHVRARRDSTFCWIDDVTDDGM